MRISQAAAIGLFALTPALTGCLVHKHTVLKTRPPEIVYSSSLDQLLEHVDEQYKNIRTMTAYVDIVACEGEAARAKRIAIPNSAASFCCSSRRISGSF